MIPVEVDIHARKEKLKMRTTRFDEPLFLRVTKGMKDRLRERADEEEVTESALVREALRDRLKSAPATAPTA